MSLPELTRPTQIIEHVEQHGFQYRADATRIGGRFIPLDWITHPEVFEARLRTDQTRDGDCDDWHFYALTLLDRMTLVERAFLLSIMWHDDDGAAGHTTCVFQSGEQWFLMDYQIIPLDDPRDAVELVLNDRAAVFVVWETPRLTLVAEGVDSSPVA